MLFVQKSSGAIAQLGERLPCTQEVGSSILPGSTNFQCKVSRIVHYGFCYFVLLQSLFFNNLV